MSVLRNIKIIFIFSLLININCSSSGDNPDDGNPPDGGGNEDFLKITLNTNINYQTIHGFGASDAWSTQFVGKNWPLDKKNHIANLLFSTQFDSDNNPLGIGLNTWRFNIGAGSASQGNASGISDEWRRAESFINSNGYDWTAHEGQRWFVDAAKQRGVNQFIAFSNSPPITMTKNGKAYSSGGSSANLDLTKHNDYADFLATVIENYKNLYGIEFNYISPFNEPQWDWNGGQEGSPWQNTEIANVTTLLNSKLAQKNLNSQIEISEAGQLNYLYENGNKTGRANQIEEFFSSTSANYLGNLSHVAKKIAGHSYYTTYDTSYLIDVRSKLDDKILSTNSSLEFWMTEYCPLEDNSEIVGNGRDLGIEPALYLGRVIHTDLTVANASSWQWWLAVSPYDYKDGLVYIDDNKFDGVVYESKLLWGLGNFSRFIKKGYKRIDLSRSDNISIEQSISGLLVSAYKDPSTSKYVVVLVNQRNIEIPIKLVIPELSSFSAKKYLTSGLINDNLSYKGSTMASEIVKIPQKSIVTLVIE